jgi:beta-lactamase regulating signal transducer with metallopeptidase domain
MIMLRINKNLALFSGVIIVAFISLAVFIQKLPQLTSHAVYYCQSALLSFLTPIPQQAFLLPFAIFAIFAIMALAKILVVVIKTHMLRQHLIKHSMYSRSTNEILTKLAIYRDTHIVKSSKPFAFCLGIIHSKIYISSALLKLLTKTELEIVLRHEKYHVENKDSLIMIIASFVTTLLPFLPILSDFVRNYRIEREIKADEEALKGSDKSNLISVLKKLLVSTPSEVAFAPAIFEHDTLGPRIAAITNSGREFKRYNARNLAVSMVFLSLILFAAMGPVHAMHVHSDNSHLIMLHATEDSCLDWSNNLNIHSPH